MHPSILARRVPAGRLALPTAWLSTALLLPILPGSTVPADDLAGGLDEPLSAAGIHPAGPRAVRPMGTPTQRYDHGDPTPAEQGMLERVNRARANPGAEAARLGIGLNDGLAAGAIADTPKQPLAFNPQLIASARAHSQWMLDTDTFSHTGANASSAGDRMMAAGYLFSGSWTWGENIAWQGSTGTPNLESFTAQMHDALFKSAGHRQNLCNGGFDELGIGVLPGLFAAGGRTYNAAMATQNFARSAATPAPLLVGVVYRDANGNGAYDPGEGVPGITVVPASGVHYAMTSASGGYAFPYEAGTGSLAVTFSGGTLAAPVARGFARTGANVKLDLEITGQAAPPAFVTGTAAWNPLQGFTVTVSGSPGARFILQQTADLASWTSLATNTLSGTTQTVTLGPTPGAIARLYRLVSVP